MDSQSNCTVTDVSAVGDPLPDITPFIQLTDILVRGVIDHLNGTTTAIVESATAFCKLLDEQSEGLAHALKGMGTVLSRMTTVMVELGWPPIPFLDTLYAADLIRRYDVQGLAAIEQELEEYLLELYDHDHLQAIVSRWEQNRRLARRLPILRQVVDAHVSGQYWVSVPAMLPQIEGIIPELYGHDGSTGYNGARMKEHLEQMLTSKSFLPFDGWMRLFYSEVLMASFAYGSPPRSRLSRHAILHGYDTTYGSAANSLRSILAFDFLQQELQRLVSVRRGGCYHVLGCAAIKADPSVLVYHDSIQSAEKLGKKPCQRCKPRRR